jgi:hypothetical protein
MLDDILTVRLEALIEGVMVVLQETAKPQLQAAHLIIAGRASQPMLFGMLLPLDVLFCFTYCIVYRLQY